MKGELLVTVAAELAAGPTEAHHRSAVSRAYYGAFHVARRLLEEVGVHLPKGEQVHAKAVYCFQGCGDVNAGVAANELVALRGERNRADYDVDRLVYEKRAARTQVERAQGIMKWLEQCRSGPNAAEFRVKVRAQAKLLGLPVSP
jgi:uncharacterized protein (UPF0332 family)